MAETPVTGGSFYHCSILFKAGGQGWSENYWINVSGSGDLKTTAEGAAGLVASARWKVLPTDAASIALRTSDDLVSHAALLAVPPTYSMGPGAGSGKADQPGWGWLARSSTETGIAFGITNHRCWTTADLQYNVENGNKVEPSPVARNWGIRMKTIITNPYTAGGNTARFVLQSFVKPSATELPVNWVAMTGNPATNRLTFTIPSSAAGRFSVGDMVKITTPKKRCVRGLNGIGQVLSVTTTGGGPLTEVEVKKTVCCPPTTYSDVLGSLFPRRRAFYYITRWEITGLGDRAVGRAFFVQPGRRSVRCC